MRSKLPLILLFHVDFRLSFTQRFFFVQKELIGGTICQPMYLKLMDVMVSKGRHFSIFSIMIDMLIVCNDDVYLPLCSYVCMHACMNMCVVVLHIVCSYM